MWSLTDWSHLTWLAACSQPNTNNQQNHTSLQRASEASRDVYVLQSQWWARIQTNNHHNLHCVFSQNPMKSPWQLCECVLQTDDCFIFQEIKSKLWKVWVNAPPPREQFYSSMYSKGSGGSGSCSSSSILGPCAETGSTSSSSSSLVSFMMMMPPVGSWWQTGWVSIFTNSDNYINKLYFSNIYYGSIKSWKTTWRLPRVCFYYQVSKCVQTVFYAKIKKIFCVVNLLQ